MNNNNKSRDNKKRSKNNDINDLLVDSGSDQIFDGGYPLEKVLSDAGNQNIQDLFNHGLAQAKLRFNQSADVYVLICI